MIRGNSTVWVGPNAAKMSAEEFPKPSSFHNLDVPDGADTRELATSEHGPWAALLFAGKGSKTKQMLVWNVVEGRRSDVVLPDTQVPNHIAFVDKDLYIGYLSGDVKRFRFRDNAWRNTDSQRLPARVVALGGRDGTGDIYAVVSEANNERPAVIGLSKADLTTTAQAQIESGTAIAHVKVLRDGQVVVGTGAGVITFLTSHLQVRGTHVDGQLQFVMDITEVPGFRQVLVSGPQRSIVLDQVTRAPQANAWDQGAPFLSASRSPDGHVLATYGTATSDVAIWTLDKPDLRSRVCQAVGRDLTPEEWTTYVGLDLSYQPVCRR